MRWSGANRREERRGKRGKIKERKRWVETNKWTTDRDGVEVPVPGEDPGELELDGSEEEVCAGVDHGVGVVVGVQHPVRSHRVWGGGRWNW